MILASTARPVYLSIDKRGTGIHIFSSLLKGSLSAANTFWDKFQTVSSGRELEVQRCYQK